jgi:mitochondrial-processing peptidase subunit alpha
MLNVMVNEMEELCYGLKEVDLERAKFATIAMIHTALESKVQSAEDIGRQLLTWGHR